nr:OstA-like protein [Mangrovimonas aestuarii]
MKVPYRLLLCLFIGVLSSLNSVAQEQKRITIKYSGFLTVDEEKYPGAKVLTRNDQSQVHIVHEGVNMWCDQAIHYANDDFIEAYGNVKMIQGDTINMVSNYVEYSGKTQLAFASGNVKLTDPSSTLTTDTLYFDRTRQQTYYQSGGTVVRDTSGTITSRIGRYYMDTQKYKFVDNVVLVNPDYTMETQQLDYYTETGYAFMYGPSTITGEESKIYCERGFYDTQNDTGYFVKKSRIDYDNRIVEGDSLFFDRNRSFASANNNIKVTDTLNHSIIKGHYAEVYKDKDSVFITKRALAITVQDNDSIYMHSDTLMVTGTPEHRITRAFRNVKMYKSDMSGKADSVHVDHKTGLTQMINLSRLSSGDAFAVKRRPILWNIDNQMTGDTIHLKSNPKTEKLDSLIVFYDAFLISKDTLDDGFNQITGKRLVGLFDDNNNLNTVDIIKNAESIYYLRNENQELVGIDKSRSGSMKLFFSENMIDEVRKIKQVDGATYPEEQFPENVRKLKGFDWRGDERPSSVEDLFKGDPPLELPVIKGLDPYEPQEEFVDEKMLKRIEKADKESKQQTNDTLPSRASRTLPKKINKAPKQQQLKSLNPNLKKQ